MDKIKILDHNGDPLNHLEEATGALNSVNDAIKGITTQLNNPGILSPQAIADLAAKLADLQALSAAYVI